MTAADYRFASDVRFQYLVSDAHARLPSRPPSRRELGPGTGFAVQPPTTMATTSESGKTVTPAFLKLDDRVPASLRELLLEADTCVTNGLMIGATGCAQRAIEALLKLEKVEGSGHEARVRSLNEKTPGLPQLLITVLSQLGDVSNNVKLPANTLQLLLATVKAVAYEIYVVAPERSERTDHIRRLLDSTERKPVVAAAAAAAAAESKPAVVTERKATPATLASMGGTP
jgi:hypothetical protein